MKRLNVLAFSGCLFTAMVALHAGRSHAENQTSVNKSLSVEAGGKTQRVRSVNGNVRIASNATVESLANVNGDIRLNDGNSARSISNVNGDIQATQALRVGGDVSNVNGEITLGVDAQIGGEVTTVNGGISQSSGTIGQDVNTVNGDVRLGTVTVQGNVITVWGDVELNGAAIKGSVRVTKPRHSNYWGKDPQPPRIVLGAGASVAGEIILEQPALIYVHQSAVMPKISGAMVGGNVIAFSGTQAPSR
jgi:DUF4097 and DUF4098 domain-containing protein YvlB